MKNCPKGPRGPNDWIPVNHRKKPRENIPTQTPNSENTPPSAPSPPPPDLTTTTTNLSPPSSAHTPPKDPLPIQFSPTKAPSTIMEIDTDPLPSDNDEIIIIDDTGPYVLGLAAVFKDRPITSVSTKFGSLPPSPCITSLNPFAPLLTNPSSSDQPSSSSKTRVSFPPETLTPPLPISSSPVQIITPPSTTKPLVMRSAEKCEHVMMTSDLMHCSIGVRTARSRVEDIIVFIFCLEEEYIPPKTSVLPRHLSFSGKTHTIAS
ncbi:hypothetical protein YC2023_013900 [Brassica napus]